MILIVFAAGVLMLQSPEPEAQDWQSLLASGKQAYAKRDYVAATDRFTAAALAAAGTRDSAAGLVDSLRLLAAVHRDTADYARAEAVLQRAAEHCRTASLPVPTLATLLGELAAAQRAKGEIEASAASIEEAIRIRESQPEPGPDLARDLTFAALLRLKSGDTEKTIGALKRAVDAWDIVSPGNPQAIPAVEALATAYRDNAQYAEAEPLLVRALRLREAAGDPDGAEVITAVDSLAYVQFGLKNFVDAEAHYKRLLGLWQKHGGPDHPMTALTYDKMAEFYAFQQRYDEAETCAKQALDARTRTYVGSLNQTGRLLIMQAKIPEAEDHYRRAVQIADLAKASDEVSDPVLRIYARILRELKRDEEAVQLEARVKESVIKRGEQEGRRTPPGQKP